MSRYLRAKHELERAFEETRNIELIPIIDGLHKEWKKGVLDRVKWEPTYITTNFPPSHEFHDDQISDEEVVVKDFPCMQIFGDFRVFNGLTIKEFDEFLARLVPIFCELKRMHEKKMGGVGKSVRSIEM